MNGIINFASDHYLIFLIITIILIFALVGYYVNIKRSKSNPIKTDNLNLEADLHIVDDPNINTVSTQSIPQQPLQQPQDSNENLYANPQVTNNNPTETVDETLF